MCMFINDVICLSYQLLKLNGHADAIISAFVLRYSCILLIIFTFHLKIFSLILFLIGKFGLGH